MIREVDESQEPASSYRAAFEEIRADAHQDLLVGEVDGEVVATAQVTWVRHLTYVGGLRCQLESVRVRSDRRGERLGRRLVEHVVAEARARGGPALLPRRARHPGGREAAGARGAAAAGSAATASLREGSR